MDLKAEKGVLDKYKALSKSDVKASTVIVGQNIPGQRDPTLSWIWSMDVAGDTQSEDWLEDCKFFGRILCRRI